MKTFAKFMEDMSQINPATPQQGQGSTNPNDPMKKQLNAQIAQAVATSGSAQKANPAIKKIVTNALTQGTLKPKEIGDYIP